MTKSWKDCKGSSWHSTAASVNSHDRAESSLLRMALKQPSPRLKQKRKYAAQKVFVKFAKRTFLGWVDKCCRSNNYSQWGDSQRQPGHGQREKNRERHNRAEETVIWLTISSIFLRRQDSCKCPCSSRRASKSMGHPNQCTTPGTPCLTECDLTLRWRQGHLS